ncbi:MAG: hypothetical protein D6824_00950 [Planctomycetota bacterium]|nr:MAG: hypothetical protein D6824_00950 [Planctomycetota bacterium]
MGTDAALAAAAVEGGRSAFSRDPRLAGIVEAWATLPADVQRSIVLLVKASQEQANVPQEAAG